MAAADYRLCDVCSSKTFYDAALDYRFPGPHGGLMPGDDPAQWPEGLHRLGAWAVLCIDCAKTHDITITTKAKARKTRRKEGKG